ncbi:MAG: hypothetical protein ACJ763_13820 [Bdellovibrionia bacterium]
MHIRLLSLALVVALTGLASLGTSCNRAREESHDRPGSAPQVAQTPGLTLAPTFRPAGDPNVIAPPRYESKTADQGEGAGVAAGHTKKEQKID